MTEPFTPQETDAIKSYFYDDLRVIKTMHKLDGAVPDMNEVAFMIGVLSKIGVQVDYDSIPVIHPNEFDTADDIQRSATDDTVPPTSETSENS